MLIWSLGWEDPLEEGNGNPLQYSCLENPMDRGAWWASVHRAAKSQHHWAHTHTHTHTHSIWWLHGIALKTWPNSPKCWNMNVNIHACSYLPLLQFTINQITWESNPVKDLHAPSSATWAARSPLFCSPSFSIELLKPMPWSPTQQWFSGPRWSDLVNPVVLIAP